MMTTQPSLFISHGAPTIVIEDSPAAQHWRTRGLGAQRPDAAIVVTAHWEAPAGAAWVGGAEAPETIYDFYGFPKALYQLTHPAPGLPALAARVSGALSDAGFAAKVDQTRGYDHGVWTPMMLMDPDATVPITPVATPAGGPDELSRLGEALAPFREENILVIASGALTHNLGALRGLSDAENAKAAEYADWMGAAVEAGDHAALTAHLDHAPHARWNHPTTEHIDPLFAAFGAGGGRPGETLHRSWSYGALAMDGFAFG